jgi:formamidopyrimidine-DNA glycosylase
MVPRSFSRLQSAAVPELPDLAILADALDTALSGRPLRSIVTPQSLVVRGTPAELNGYVGQRLVGVWRRGKFLGFQFERDRMLLNPMLTGRLGLASPKTKPLPNTAVAMTFGPRAVDEGPERRSRPLPEWPGTATWLPAGSEDVELRYRDSTRMGKLYLLPEGVTRDVAGWAEQGPDADDPALTLEEWRARIKRHTGELKNLLRKQEFVSGIGNAYSDEILWAARLAPTRTRASLAPDEVDALYAAAREVLPWAIARLHELVPPRLEVEQRKFLNVHMKGGEACPRCGARISEISAGGFVMNFCRGCQR